jgi:hypothetical protein
LVLSLVAQNEDVRFAFSTASPDSDALFPASAALAWPTEKAGFG